MSLAISIFSRVALSQSIFSKRVDISIIDMAYRYIEHPYRLLKERERRVKEGETSASGELG